MPEAVNERRPPGEVTELLLAWSGGKQSALDRLVPLMYPELRRLAHGCMRGEREDHILQTSALINEAYLRLVDSARVKWQDRAHFLAVSANTDSGSKAISRRSSSSIISSVSNRARSKPFSGLFM